MQTHRWQPPEVVNGIVTATDIAEDLGLDRKIANRLIRAGLLGDVYALDGPQTRLAGERDELERLTSRLVLDPDDSDLPAAIVVRVGDPQPEEGSDREWTGWHVAMPEDIAEAATARWWPLARNLQTIAPGALLIVSLGSVIVRVRRILEVNEAPGFARVSFKTSEAVGPDADIYIGRRIESRRGPVATPVNLH